MRGDTWDGIKRLILGFSAAIALFLFAHWVDSLWSGADVHSDGEPAERITDDIHDAQESVDGATVSIDRAGEANQEAQDTAGDIEQGNRK